jgi:hypothetical protein
LATAAVPPTGVEVLFPQESLTEQEAACQALNNSATDSQVANKSFLLVVPNVVDAQRLLNVSSEELSSLGVLDLQPAASAIDSSPTPNSTSSGVNLAAIIGGVASALGLLMILGGVLLRRRRSRSKTRENDNGDGMLFSTLASANERWFSSNESSKWNKKFDRVRDEELLTMTAGIDLTFLEDPLLAGGGVSNGSAPPLPNREDLL